MLLGGVGVLRGLQPVFADLRGPLRAGAADDELAALVSGVWQARTDRYSEIRASVDSPGNKVEMYRIGG